MTMKNNIHIILIVLVAAVALAVAIFLGSNIKQQDAMERQNLLSDTAAINDAHRIYERVHHEQMMQDSSYAKLYRENQELKAKIRHLKDSVQ